MSIYYIDILKRDIEKIINEHLSGKLFVKYKIKAVTLDSFVCKIKAFPVEITGKEGIIQRYKRLAEEEKKTGILDPLVECLQDNIVNILKNTTCTCDESTFAHFEIYSNLWCTLSFNVKYTNNDSMILFQLEL